MYKKYWRETYQHRNSPPQGILPWLRGSYSFTTHLPSRPPGNTEKSMVTGWHGISTSLNKKNLSCSDDHKEPHHPPQQGGTGLSSMAVTGQPFREQAVFSYSCS